MFVSKSFKVVTDESRRDEDRVQAVVFYPEAIRHVLEFLSLRSGRLYSEAELLEIEDEAKREVPEVSF